jgi:L-ascorbate metabolism protein UlaG (beta-lactamase superfamily)
MQSDGGIRITWLGHATTLLETSKGKSILIDPWLEGNPAVPEGRKTMDRLDLMLITHAHTDHMGDAVSVARRTNADVVAIFELCEYLGTKGIQNCTGMNKGGTVEWEGIHITMVDAVHSSGFMEFDRLVYGGTAAGYVIRFENDFTIYNAGDTDVFESMKLIGQMHEPDLALLPIGDHFTMGPSGAAEAIRILGVKRVIPIHYGTFPLLSGTPAELEKEASDVRDLRIIALKPGESVSQTDIL